MGWVVNLLILWAFHHYATGIFRLPGDVIPKHYDLMLVYDLDPGTNFSYFGTVDILLSANKDVSKIYMHARNIQLVENKIMLTTVRSLISGDKTTIPVDNITINTEDQYYVLNLKSNMITGETYFLSLPFDGQLKLSETSGVYVNHFTHRSTGIEEYSIGTGFEPIYARKCFPCFDEPHYKATYSISIGHHMAFESISSMPTLYNKSRNIVMSSYFPVSHIAKTFAKNLTRWIWHDFEISKPISTHHVAFVISNYTKIKSPWTRNYNGSSSCNVWARIKVISEATYAASIALDIVYYYELYFNMDLPPTKLHHVFDPVLVPRGTNNFGVIMYPEHLLFNTYVFKKDVMLALIKRMSQEVARQWMGNLVTLKFWNEFWVIEGFSRFMSHLSLESLLLEKVANGSGILKKYPHFTNIGYLPNTYVRLFAKVLLKDALQTAYPVSLPFEATHPKRINEIYNKKAHNKAAILIRMLHRAMGDEGFREAITNFLTKYSYQTFVQDDLWHEMDTVNDKNASATHRVSVKKVMDSWTTKPGYPLISVVRDYEKKSMKVSQKRFMITGDANDSASWWVPLVVLSESDDQSVQQPYQWLGEGEGVQEPFEFLYSAGADEWLVVNANAIALCRVNYDLKNWILLTKALKKRKFYKLIPPMSRAQLLTDAFALARKGKLEYGIAFQLAKYLVHEADVEVLYHGLQELAVIDSMLRRTSDYEVFQTYMRSIVRIPYRKFGQMKPGPGGQPLNTVLLQKYISKWACDMDVPICHEAAIDLFDKWMKTKYPGHQNPIPIDLRDTVYCWGVALGGAGGEQWRFMRAWAYNASADDVTDAVSALACTNDPSLMQQTVNIIGSGDFHADNVLTTAMLKLLRNPVGFYLGTTYFYRNFEKLFSGYTTIDTKQDIIKILTDQFVTQDELNEFLQWRNKSSDKLEDLNPVLDSGTEKAQDNIAWIASYKKWIVANMTQIIKESARLGLKEASDTSNASKMVLTKINVMLTCYTCLVIQITCYHLFLMVHNRFCNSL